MVNAITGSILVQQSLTLNSTETQEIIFKFIMTRVQDTRIVSGISKETIFLKSTIVQSHDNRE